jgi:ubiquinone/menaquinone biosynthesis C-methylase UbiE
MTNCPITGAQNFEILAEQGGMTWIRFPDSNYICLRDMPSLAEAEAIQDESIADEYIASYDRKFASKLKRSLRRARYLKRRLESGNRVLDVGCNVGFFVEACRQLGLDAHGIDINRSLVSAAQRNFPEITVSTIAVEDYSPDVPFNGLYCSEVIEHTVDPFAFASELYRLLAKGGALYLTTPSSDEYLKGGTVVRDLGAPDHKLYFNSRNIGPFLRRVGFRDVSHKLARGGGLQLIARK